MEAQTDRGSRGERKSLQDLKLSSPPDLDQAPLLLRLARRSWLSEGARHQRVLYIVALVLFASAFLLAYRELPRLELSPVWLLLIAAFVPMIMFLNGLELVIAGKAVQQRLGVLEAIRIGVLATSANLLPIPGAILVRTQVLKEGGSRYRDALRSTGAIGVGWLATSFLLAGVFQWGGRPSLALILLLAGVASTAIVAVLLKFSTDRLTVIGAIFAVEMLFVLVTAIRLYAGFMAIQTPISMDQAFVLAIAAALASAVGVLPGGLGLRELIAGALSPLVGLPVATGVVVTAIDRLVGMSIFGIVSILLLTVLRRTRFR